MKKKLFSMAMTLVMCLSLLPAGAAAAPVRSAGPEPAGVSVRGAVRFEDVKESDWFYEGVEYTVNKGLFKGISDTKFGPTVKMTRGMVVQILYAMAGKPAVSGHHRFPDVKDSDWFSGAVAWAVEKGVASGYDDGRFGPNDTITREQLAVMLHGYMRKPVVNTPLHFADAGEVSDWAEAAMRWAVANHLMSGTDQGLLLPGHTATRAEGAVIMMNFDRLNPGSVPPSPGGDIELPIIPAD